MHCLSMTLNMFDMLVLWVYTLKVGWYSIYTKFYSLLCKTASVIRQYYNYIASYLKLKG